MMSKMSDKNLVDSGTIAKSDIIEFGRKFKFETNQVEADILVTKDGRLIFMDAKIGEKTATGT